MAFCPICKNTVARDDKSSIACYTCKIIFHNKCCNFSDTDAIQLKKKHWNCSNCESTAKPIKQHSITLSKNMDENIITILREIGKLSENSSEIKKTVNQQSDIIFENSERLKSMEERAKRQDELIEKLLSENNTLRAQVKTMEVKLNQMEQSQLSNSLEIRGIPTKTGETPEGVVCAVGAALGIKLSAEDLDSVERKRPRGEDPRPPSIVVRFVRQTIRDEVIRLRKVKRDFSTRHLGWDTDERIYVSEEMTSANRHLYWLARQKRAAGKIKYIWFARGRVRCRRDDGMPVVIINKEEDIEAFQ